MHHAVVKDMWTLGVERPKEFARSHVCVRSEQDYMKSEIVMKMMALAQSGRKAMASSRRLPVQRVRERS
jgi:hypothetical protein